MFIYSKHYGCNNPSVVTVVAKLQGAGSTAALTVAAGRGIESVARTDTGAHTITLKDTTLGACIGGFLTVSQETASGVSAQFVNAGTDELYDSTNQQVKVQIWDLATPTEADLTADDQLCMVLFFTKSTLPVT